MNRLLKKFTFSPEIVDVIENCKGIYIPTTKQELHEMVFGTGRSGKYDVVYDVPGRGEVVEATEFKHALVDLCMKYVPEAKRSIGKAMEKDGPHTSVWAIDIEEISGKAHPGPRGDASGDGRTDAADDGGCAGTDAGRQTDPVAGAEPVAALGGEGA